MTDPKVSAGGAPATTRVGPSSTAAAPAIRVGPATGSRRRARLVIKHIDPWTAMKVTFVTSLAILVVGVVAVAIVYAVLGGMGVWDQLNNFVNEVSPTTTPQALHNPFSASRVITIAAALGAINVIILTALATLGAAIYNLIADLVGGIEVTLGEP